jgi:thiosulfate/3-mercaptopyruvate sulfurtransferase
MSSNMSYVHPEYLIEAEELAQEIGAPDLKIFDATVFLKPAKAGYRAESGLADYQQGHIPGSAFLDQMSGLSDTGTGLGFSLPTVAALEAGLRQAGVSDGDRVVVYSSAHMMWATRAWWLLHYAGVEQVAVLNGGLPAWRALGLAESTGEEVYPPGDLTARPRPARFVDQTEVQSAIGQAGVCTVNALAPDVYSGDAEMSYGRKGHITGSINLHYEDVLENGRFRSAEALTEVLQSKGMLDAERVIAYCGGGISATIDALACLLIGKDEVAVYDGSMSEWVRDESLPMTLGNDTG